MVDKANAAFLNIFLYGASTRLAGEALIHKNMRIGKKKYLSV
jgi:hypothetical protein